MLDIYSLLVSRNTVLYSLELSVVFSPVLPACRAGEMLLTTLCVAFKGENSPFMKIVHFTKMTSIYSTDKLHPQLCISKGRHISSAQKCSIMNAVANKCHNIDEFTCTVPTAELLTATAKKTKRNTSSSSLPCLVRMSPPALPAHLLLPHTDL